MPLTLHRNPDRYNGAATLIIGQATLTIRWVPGARTGGQIRAIIWQASGALVMADVPYGAAVTVDPGPGPAGELGTATATIQPALDPDQVSVQIVTEPWVPVWREELIRRGRVADPRRLPDAHQRRLADQDRGGA